MTESGSVEESVSRLELNIGVCVLVEEGSADGSEPVALAPRGDCDAEEQSVHRPPGETCCSVGGD